MRLAKNPNAKSRYVSRSIRNRRTTIDPADLDISSEDVEALEACDGTEEGPLAAFCEDDLAAENSNFKLTKVFKSVSTSGQPQGNNELFQSSMSTETRKLKRYTTSIAKWCQRYISECHGQRVHEHCVNRAIKFYNQLKPSG